MEVNACFMVANRLAIAAISWLPWAISFADKEGKELELSAGDGSEGTISKAPTGSVSCNPTVNEGRSITGVAGDVGGVWKGAILDCRSAEIDRFLFSKADDEGEDPVSCVEESSCAPAPRFFLFPLAIQFQVN